MITVLTSNHPRHRYLINTLAKIDSVWAVVEKFDNPHTTIVDPVMEEYFTRMRLVEKVMFPEEEYKAYMVDFIEGGTISEHKLSPLARRSDKVVVFGCGWIKNPLFNQIKDKAINIHMGVGYRGASCNAHAYYEGRKHLVGATIQKLSEGLDNGEPLFYAYGTWRFTDYFTYSMSAVKNAIDKLGWYLQTGSVDMDAPEDKYTAYKKKTDFTLEMARKICKL